MSSCATSPTRSRPSTAADPGPHEATPRPIVGGAAVVVSTAVTDAAYVFFNAAVGARKRVAAATWSSCWYLLSAFAVISYTQNWVYVAFAAVGSWLGAFLTITFLRGRHGAGPDSA